MEQLLQITTTPMKCQYTIERARLEHQQEFQPRADVTTVPSELRLRSRSVQVQLDTYQARRSLGIERVGDRIRKMAQTGMDSIHQKTREYVEMGQQMAQPPNSGVTIPQMIQNKMLSSAQPTSYTAFLPTSGAEISWIPNQLETEYDPGSVNYSWKQMRNALNYVPASVRMEILEYAKVEIKYLGGPMYIPRSADPNYVEPEAV